MRIQKTVGEETSNYYYVNGQLAYEKRGEKEFYYLYDSDGNLASIRYIRNGSSTTYYAAVNSRGDTEALYNGRGSLVARYLYDSWGNMVSVQDETGNEITDAEHIGNVNPIRYRGYFTLDGSIGVDNSGVSGSWTNGNKTNSFGVKMDVSKVKIGFEYSTAIQWDNTTQTNYINVSVSGWWILAAYAMVTNGQSVPQPAGAY